MTTWGGILNLGFSFSLLLPLRSGTFSPVFAGLHDDPSRNLHRAPSKLNRASNIISDAPAPYPGVEVLRPLPCFDDRTCTYRRSSRSAPSWSANTSDAVPDAGRPNNFQAWNAGVGLHWNDPRTEVSADRAGTARSHRVPEVAVGVRRRTLDLSRVRGPAPRRLRKRNAQTGETRWLRARRSGRISPSLY
jgi:hypothetical protein